MVVDVRADDRIEVKDVEAFAVTAQVCALVGWEFRRVGGIGGPHDLAPPSPASLTGRLV